MPFVIRYDTWTVEETTFDDIRDPKYATELEAEQMLAKEITVRLRDIRPIHNSYWHNRWTEKYDNCKKRIQNLKQQSI